MAYVEMKYCPKCKEGKATFTSFAGGQPSYVCDECAVAVNNITDERKKHFGELDNLSIPQRVRRLEEWVYDYTPEYVEPQRDF